MPRRSSRSRPCSFTSCSEPLGSATRAIATALLSRSEAAHMVTAKLTFDCGQGSRLAPRGAPKRARPLVGVLPRVRGGAAVVRRARGRGAGHLLLRRQDAPPLPGLRRAVLLDVRRRLRELRRPAPPPRAPRHAHPQAGALGPARQKPKLGAIAENRMSVTVSSSVTSR